MVFPTFLIFFNLKLCGWFPSRRNCSWFSALATEWSHLEMSLHLPAQHLSPDLY